MQSAEGVQQGDPLGPLLFCLTIQPLIQDLQSEFKVFYLDDGTIGGSLEDVHHDLLLVEEKAALLGLQLNRAKSKLVCDDANTRESMLSVVSELRTVCCSEATLLGTPIGSVELIDSTITSKIQNLRLMGDKFRFLKSQEALSLLRHSFAIPKVLYILRTAPCFRSEQLEVFDCVLRDSCPPSSMLTSTMAQPGYKPLSQCVLGVLEFVGQFSWHPLPIWPLLLAAQR